MYLNGKMRCVETIPEMEEGVRENNGKREFNYNILQELCKCHNYPSKTIIKKFHFKCLMS
jgi:hypothetical protein